MNIKKSITILTALGFSLGLLTGCNESTPLLTADAYTLEAETDRTSLGVAPGDTAETFLDAYGEYKIFTSTDGEDYQMLSSDEFSPDSVVTTLLPTFFVDGMPVDPDVFCKENEIEKENLITFLSSADYLTSHTVEYRYLVFSWENGTITEIRSEYMNYNEDGAN